MAKRKKKKGPWKRRKVQGSRRRAQVVKGKTKRIYEQGDGRRYNVQMIRDFLDHLLLELRALHFEQLKSLRELEASNDAEQALAAAAELSDSLRQQFASYQKKYASALIAVDAIDGTDATEQEEHDVMKAVLSNQVKRRDDQIGHMEALQELFEEALHCAKLPFGVDSLGKVIQPMTVHSVREIVDDTIDAPDYDELIAKFEGHGLTSDEGIQALRDAEVVVATNPAFERPLVIFGLAAIERFMKEGGKRGPGMSVDVADAAELEFLVSAVYKFKGRHDYRGNYFDEF